MQGIPVFKKEGNKKILVSTWYGEEEKKPKKELRLFIGEEEIDVKECMALTERDETSPFDGASVIGVAGNYASGNTIVEDTMCKSPSLSMELRMMKEEKKNRFALLRSEDTDEEDNYKTPLRKSFARMVVPDAPLRVRTHHSKMTDFKPERLCFDEKKIHMSSGAWNKPLSKTIEEKYGDMDAWKRTRVRSFEEVVEGRKKALQVQLDKMRGEIEELKGKVEKQKETEKMEEIEKEQDISSVFLKQTKIVCWADMMEDCE
jgi:hypothetical protein